MILPEEIKRDEYGQWTHSEWDAFCNGREAVPRGEVDAWLDKHGLEMCLSWLQNEDEDHPASVEYFEKDRPDFSAWELSPPTPDGKSVWFLISIHDTEDGPVQVWARRKPMERT